MTDPIIEHSSFNDNIYTTTIAIQILNKVSLPVSTPGPGDTNYPLVYFKIIESLSIEEQLPGLPAPDSIEGLVLAEGYGHMRLKSEEQLNPYTVGSKHLQTVYSPVRDYRLNNSLGRYDPQWVWFPTEQRAKAELDKWLTTLAVSNTPKGESDSN